VPSRARRQFAARLAKRRAEAEAAIAGDDGDDDDEDDDDDNAPTHGKRVEPRSDDSVDLDNDDDQGIVMRKTGRRTLAGRRLFSFEDEESDDDDDNVDGSDGRKMDEADAFERLGIKVQSPGEIDGGNSSDEVEVDDADETGKGKGRAKDDV
jgi:hypothetical protein